MNKGQILQELEKVADKLDMQIRYEKGNFNSGYCRVEEQKMLIIKKDLNLDQKISILCIILNEFDLSDIYILPKIRTILDNYNDQD
ncbi:hypothetical protein ACFL4T_07825 [candidate division KSB1 bacterium]